MGSASGTRSATPTVSDCSNRQHKCVNDATMVSDARPIQARCSVKAIHDIISTFDDRKRKLVESIGFGGLLKFPPIKSTNRRFSAWLMGMVDIRKSCLTLLDGSSLKFSSKDIGLIFGIPASGKKISEAGQLDKTEKERMKLQCWPLSGAKHDYVHVDYWGALSNPKKIHEFDWAAYVHKRLIASAAKYKADTETGSKAPNITGCYLFLQVFYLDNMDISNWSMDHVVRPRISCFTYDKLRNMIAADTHQRHSMKSAFVFGKSKVRPREQSCYTWAQPNEDNPINAQREDQISLWHAVIRMATILRVPLESTGPLFLAAADFDHQSKKSNPHSGIHCINVLLGIMEPFVKGFKYNFDLLPRPTGPNSFAGDFDVSEHLIRYLHGAGMTYTNISSASTSQAAGSVAAVPLHDMESATEVIPKRPRFTACSPAEDITFHRCVPSVGGVDYSVIKSMSRFYMLLQYIRQHHSLDLNATSDGYDKCPPVTTPEGIRVVSGARSPWELGGIWNYNTLEQQELTAVTEADASSSNMALCSMPRIVDYNPKYIEVMPEAAREQRMGLCELEMDMFDAIIRSFRYSDDSLYSTQGGLRWRHFFESDILAAVIAGWFDINNPCMRNQFVGSHLTYDIYNCNMLFFPVILHQRWVCFSWDLRENRIIVFDPACMNIPGFPSRSIYTRVADMMKAVFSSVIPDLFPGWNHEWSAASVLPFHWRYGGMPCANRTGVLCAYFCKCFDGRHLMPEMEQGHVRLIAEKLFTEVTALHEKRVGGG
ncbi:hypothetical protein BDA96_01G179200 [Sorghum bicolor]|uniref:Ubiquitin-like protease family profile domain-containing protein n=1 Tax=Sorghum bicolor TaxID=4558 RepID=A0A921UXK1_SORBI|nr:hypothetical protein BDA96_01G179200 [Sorghum bicolor]